MQNNITQISNDCHLVTNSNRKGRNYLVIKNIPTNQFLKMVKRESKFRNLMKRFFN